MSDEDAVQRLIESMEYHRGVDRVEREGRRLRSGLARRSAHTSDCDDTDPGVEDAVRAMEDFHSGCVE